MQTERFPVLSTWRKRQRRAKGRSPQAFLSHPEPHNQETKLCYLSPSESKPRGLDGFGHPAPCMFIHTVCSLSAISPRESKALSLPKEGAGTNTHRGHSNSHGMVPGDSAGAETRKVVIFAWADRSVEKSSVEDCHDANVQIARLTFAKWRETHRTA